MNSLGNMTQQFLKSMKIEAGGRSVRPMAPGESDAVTEKISLKGKDEGRQE